MSQQIKFSNVHGQINIIKIDDNTISDFLEPKVYNLKYDENSKSYYLEYHSENFSTNMVEIYGNVYEKRDKIFNTYNDRVDKTTGVLLSGNKGSGKSLLMNIICDEALSKNMAVIRVSQHFSDVSLVNFLNDIQNSVVVFDEFDKYYAEEEDQNFLLTYLEGTLRSQKLVLFSCNDLYNINKFFLNRPGRIYYHLKYGSLGEDVVKDYCNKKLNNKDYLKSILTITKIIHDFNFDILQTLVEESNRYNEDPMDLLNDLNISPKPDQNTTGKVYKATMFNSKNKPVDLESDLIDKDIFNDFSFRYYHNQEAKKDDCSSWMNLTSHNLVKIEGNKVIFCKLGYTIEFEEQDRQTFIKKYLA